MGNSATDGKADADRGRFFVVLSFFKGSHILVLQCVRIVYGLCNSFEAHNNFSQLLARL